MQPNSATEHMDRIEDFIITCACHAPALESLAALREQWRTRDELIASLEKTRGLESRLHREQIAEMEREAVAKYIDDHGINCDCCQHVMIDVTSAQTGDKQHCVAGDCEGEGVGCAHSWHETVGQLEEQIAALSVERDTAEALATARELEADRLSVERDQALADVRGLQIGGDHAVQQIERLIVERDEARASKLAVLDDVKTLVARIERDTAQIATLEAVLREAKADFIHGCHRDFAIKRIDAALSPEAQPASGPTDTEMLDAYERMRREGVEPCRGYDSDLGHLGWAHRYYPTVRDAIRAAMGSTHPGKELPSTSGVDSADTRPKIALRNLVRVIELDDVPGYVYDSVEAECVDCGGKAATMAEVAHNIDCFQGALELARAANQESIS